MPTHPIHLLNIGCGDRAIVAPGIINLDNSPYARLKRWRLLGLAMAATLSRNRRERLARFPKGVIIHDIRRPLPFADGSVRAVYHAHVLEHLDRHTAPAFLREVARVLTSGGLHRVAVPDMEHKCRAYLKSLAASQLDAVAAKRHEQRIASIIEQSVRRDSAATRNRTGPGAWLERLILGDARQRGETHQWMYDRVTLGRLLESTGHGDVRVFAHGESGIENWAEWGLEFDNGAPHRPRSLIMEARKSGRRITP
ncbi:MAG: class I SAM-dependent methyltransferase [Gammaproteobacteria bacterium]